VALPVTLRAVQARTGVRRVLAAYALFCLVEMAMWIAIILYAFAEGGAVLAGVVAVAQLVPSAVLAPMLAGLAERLPRGRALTLAYLGVTATVAWTLAALAAESSIWVVTVAAGTSVTAIAVARPLHYAVLPSLAVGPDDLVSSISLSSMAEGLALFAGPILAGIGTQAYGTWSVVAACTVAAAVSTVLVLRLGLASAAPVHHGGEAESPLREAFGGFASLRGDRGAIALMVVLTTFFVFIGAMDVLGVAYSEDVLGLGHSGSGLLIGAAGIGAFVGAAIAASFVRRRELTPVILVSGVLLGAGLAAVALFSLLPPAMAVLAIGGLAGQLLMVAGRTLLQRSTDDSVIARVFAVQESTSLLGLALGSALAPVLVALISARGAFLPLGLGIVVTTFVCAAFIRSLDARAVYRPAEMELLRSVPFLGVLPPYELERLAKNVTWREVPEGTVVVTEGEPGRDFFIVDDGTLTVSVGGAATTAELAAPGWFGEIALLQDVPRTATVTSLTPVRLLRIQAEDFLAAVTGSADGQAIALEVAEGHLARDASRGVRT
jgi:MFS family permease